MTWDARQTAMLEAMGYRLWAAPVPVPMPAPAEPEAAPVPAPREAPRAAVQVAQALAPALPQRAAAPSSRPDIATLDWQQLQASVAGCRACGLCEGRKQTVFGVGHENAQWMIVGEAPGEQEDREGEPFVGTAGQLLDSMLRAIGLTRKAARRNSRSSSPIP